MPDSLPAECTFLYVGEILREHNSNQVCTVERKVLFAETRKGLIKINQTNQDHFLIY